MVGLAEGWRHTPAAAGQEWELCTTFNDSWGYQPGDRKFKDVRQIVRMLCECISKCGNMLISVGPDAQGRLPEETKRQMLALGEWTHKYAEAIYPTEAGLDPAYFLGGSTLSEEAMDDVCTVIKAEFDEPIDLVEMNKHARSVGGN